MIPTNHVNKDKKEISMDEQISLPLSCIPEYGNTSTVQVIGLSNINESLSVHYLIYKIENIYIIISIILDSIIQITHMTLIWDLDSILKPLLKNMEYRHLLKKYFLILIILTI